MKSDNSIKNIPVKENSPICIKSVENNAIKIYQMNPFEVKIGVELEELEQGKQLWLELSNTRSIFEQTKQQLEDRMALVYDGYDSYAKHLILRDTEQSRVVAYARMIDSHTAYNIGGFFCEAQFNLEKLRTQMCSAVELSRFVIDPDYNNADTLAMLWMSLAQYADDRGIDSIFGTLPVDLTDNHYLALKEIKRLKTKYLASNKYRVMPFQILPSAARIDSAEFNQQSYVIPSEIEYFFQHGAKLCGEPAWNKTFNQAELFFYMKPEYVQHITPIEHQNQPMHMAGMVA